MEIEEPIQQLLKSTGWSCEDLLAKLQQYKSQKDNSNIKNDSSANTRNEDTASEECVVDSTGDVNESDIPKVQNLECEQSSCKKGQESADSGDSIVTTHLSIDEEFSDTDEEEVQVNATNSSIIEEIIDDISSTENQEESTTNNTNFQPEADNEDDTAEVTEVRVIEVNSDDDDCFEDKVSQSASNTTEVVDSGKFDYLETYPRKSIDQPSVSAVHAVDNGKNGEEDSEKLGSAEQEAPESNKDSGENGILTDSEDSKESDKSNISQCEKTDFVQETNVHSPDFEKANRITTNENVLENERAKNLEDIRNNLKLQLNSLRTRKKGHFLQDLRAKVSDDSGSKKIVTSEKSDTTKKDLSMSDKSDLQTSGQTFSAVNSDNSGSCILNDLENDELYTQTNEFGLVILNVQGGIDIDNIEGTPDKSNAPMDSLNENSSNTVDSVLENSTDFNDSNSCIFDNNTVADREDIDAKGVFDEIRKIIRKQKDPTKKNKKYEISSEISKPRMHLDSSECPSESQNGEERIKNLDKPESAENSLSSFTTEDLRMIDKNSPFVSNTLDEFLTENSKLNISYKVPKCGAEEGLTVSYCEESPLILKKVIQPDDSPKPKKVQSVKAKTVAQKRKLLEKQRLKELRRAQQHSAKTGNQNVKPENIDNGTQRRDSYILVNNKKIWLKCTTANTCLGNLSPKKSTPLRTDVQKTHDDKREELKSSQQQRKLSLLNDLERKYRHQVKYRPGPLSKKSCLQVSGRDNWETEMKILPKLYLEVTPKIGEPIPRNILSRLPQGDGKLSQNQIEFALSVLKTKQTANEYKTFKFPLSYSNNQENIMVRKQRVSPRKLSSRKTQGEQKSVDSTVADILEDLIKYVEIKEIAPTLIKEDERMDCDTTDDSFSKMPAIPENVSSIFKKPQKKKSKIELELSRLSCKVVNVEVEESFTEELCNKPHCRLGCVCKSLKCDRNLTYHCQKVECMLECTCPKEKPVVYDKLTLPAGTDILSSDTVTRIEDEAKKDLAKVEREFTQTVIHTNDKTIVVGLGGRNKTRRATKAPKKYSDYVENFEAVKEQPKEKEVERGNFHRPCVVNVKRLNLPGVIPYCLFHNLYNCHCEGKSLSNDVPTKKKEINSNSVTVEEGEISERRKLSSSKKYRKKTTEELRIPKEPEEVDESVSISSSTEKEEETSVTGRPIRTIKKTKLKEDFSYSDEVYFYGSDCARVRAVSRTSRRITSRSKTALFKDDFIYNLTESDVLKARLSTMEKQMLEVDLLKNQLIAEAKQKSLANVLIADKNKHKRKQTLEIRNDDSSAKPGFNENMAIQRRKKNGLVRAKSTTAEPVFEGEIIIDQRYMELLKKMGPKTVSEGYARLLPWKALSESFRNGSIKIWCMVDQPSRLLINKSDKLPPKNYVNIRQTNQTSEVVLWILRNRLPPEYHEDNVSFILKQTKDNYEICGLCTKNFTQAASTSTDLSDHENIMGDSGENLLTFKHRDLNGDAQVLYIKKKKYKLQELIAENLAGMGETSVDKNKLYMWAALPEIYKVCKWRMIFLNSDFTYLYFTTLKYSIKYTDLVNVGNMAKVGNCTVLLRNNLIQQAYDHTAFGIYFDSHYQDRLFIGPYFKQFQSDDIETLRYINKSLVCTESFNKMQGKMDYKCGHWLIERPYGSIRRRQEIEQTIDLTKDDENGSSSSGKRKSESDINPASKRFKFGARDSEQIIILHNNEKIKVIDSRPRKPEDFNRYIITNIPHFGYLGALQHEDSNEIDVSWPFENKLLRFPTVAFAQDFLQERFSSLLQPVPETFKINVIILTSIDLEKSYPINASILSGHYICGEFGCYNVKAITDEFCKNKLGTTREELLKIFAKRAQAFVRKKIEELADLLHIPNSDLGRYDIVNILDMTKKEINDQKEIEKKHMEKKNNLLLQKRDLAMKVIDLILLLPDEHKAIENCKFRKILSKRTLLPPETITEPIEIQDSDEEDVKLVSKDVSIDHKEQPPPEPHGNSNLGSNSEEASSVLLPQSETGKIYPEVPMVSVLKDKQIPNNNKVTESAGAFPLQRTLKLKSILKPKPNHLPTTSSSGVEPSTSLLKETLYIPPKTESNSVGFKNITSSPQLLTGVKIIKTNAGQLVLVSDKNPSIGVGTKVVIKNNKILSVRSIDMINKEQEKTEKIPNEANDTNKSDNVLSSSNEPHLNRETLNESSNSKTSDDVLQCITDESASKCKADEQSNVVNEINKSVDNISDCSEHSESGRGAISESNVTSHVNNTGSSNDCNINQGEHPVKREGNISNEKITNLTVNCSDEEATVKNSSPDDKNDEPNNIVKDDVDDRGGGSSDDVIDCVNNRENSNSNSSNIETDKSGNVEGDHDSQKNLTDENL